VGNVTRYEYDTQGRMIARIDPKGRKAGYLLDNRGNTVAEVNAAGDTTRYAYDVESHVVSALKSHDVFL
jgi:YD repeat-containing protein